MATGGWDTDKVEIFDLEANRWNAAPDFPFGP